MCYYDNCLYLYQYIVIYYHMRYDLYLLSLLLTGVLMHTEMSPMT